jgi:hypothetical protein
MCDILLDIHKEYHTSFHALSKSLVIIMLQHNSRILSDVSCVKRDTALEVPVSRLTNRRTAIFRHD